MIVLQRYVIDIDAAEKAVILMRLSMLSRLGSSRGKGSRTVCCPLPSIRHTYAPARAQGDGQTQSPEATSITPHWLSTIVRNSNNVSDLFDVDGAKTPKRKVEDSDRGLFGWNFFGTPEKPVPDCNGGAHLPEH
jgi:hypothetical protein